MTNRQSRLITASVVAASAVAVIAIGLTGCAKAPGKGGPLGRQDAQPAKLVAVPGSALKEVVLTPYAAKQIGVAETPVTAGPSPKPAAGAPKPTSLTTVPVTAVIYDPEGRAWTYTIPGRFTYLRVPIVVDHVDGATAYLSSGPRAGVEVVSQGAPELLGAEYGVGEE